MTTAEITRETDWWIVGGIGYIREIVHPKTGKTSYVAWRHFQPVLEFETLKQAMEFFGHGSE